MDFKNLVEINISLGRIGKLETGTAGIVPRKKFLS
jgi:hypothetical protein